MSNTGALVSADSRTGIAAILVDRAVVDKFRCRLAHSSGPIGSLPVVDLRLTLLIRRKGFV